MDLARLLQVSVTPVVLISASGLVTLALYNRLGLINARIRHFHREKMALLRELERDDSLNRRLLLNMMNAQIDRVMAKARLMVMSLYSLLLAIALFVLCSFFAAVTTVIDAWHDETAWVAFGCFLLGLGLMLLAIVLAIAELTRSLQPMSEENAYLDFYAANLPSEAMNNPH
jgi:hypothetical protein